MRVTQCEAIACAALLALACSASPVPTPSYPAENATMAPSPDSSQPPTDQPRPSLPISTAPATPTISPAATDISAPGSSVALARGPLGTSGWIAVGASDKWGNAFPVWSPDGAHALLIGRLQSKDEATLITSSGDVVRGYAQADYAVWLDNQRFLIVTYGVGQGDRPNIGQMGTVDAASLDPVDLPPGQPLGNGHDVVSFATTDFDYAPDCDFGCPLYHYRVWQGASFSDEREGEPVGWSPDGTQLFVLHDVRNATYGTGAPAAEDFIGWLEIFALPNFESVRQYPDTKIDDRSVALDPSGNFLLYETVGDAGDTEHAHVLDLSTGEEHFFDVTQKSFAWNSQQQVVVGPQLHNPLEAYGSDGERTYLKPVHGTGALFNVKSDSVGALEDVGQGVSASSDGTVVALYDEQFMNSFPFVTLYVNGQQSAVNPFPLLENSGPPDGYFFDCYVSPGSSAIAVSCNLTEYETPTQIGLTAIYPLN